MSGKPFIKYLIVLKSAMDFILGQHDDSKKKEQTIHYLSKKFTNYQS
jgi:hypothetical protein